MIDGMDKDQFLKFRMALLPSSGFQSVQYRMIELRSTDLGNLTQEKKDNVQYIYDMIKNYLLSSSNAEANYNFANLKCKSFSFIYQRLQNI